jgi:hypothetical protein
MLRPYNHRSYEITAMRVLFAVAIWLSVLYFLPPLIGEQSKGHGLAAYPGTPEPVGIAYLIPLGWMAETGPARVVHWLLAISLLAYAFVPFRFLRWPALSVFLIHNAIFTLNNSQKSTHHGYQIMTLVLLAQALVLWYPTFCKWWPRLPKLTKEVGMRGHWVYYSQLTIAGAYIVAAVTKLLRSGLGWIVDSPLISVQVVKTHSQNFYNWLQPEYADRGMAFANWIADHPLLARVMLTSGLLLELLAFLCLLGRGWAFIIGASMVGLHVSISLVMHLHFPQNEQVCFIFLMNLPFWMVLLGQKLRPKKKTV